MDQIWPLLALIVFAALGLLIFMQVRGRALWKRLDLGPVTPAGQVEEERHISVQGVARAAATVTAPATGQDVVGYRLVVCQRDQKKPTTTILELAGGAEFTIEDASGRIAVATSGAQMLIFNRGAEGFVQDPPDDREEDRRVRTLLERHGVIFYGMCDWTEFHLPQGGRVLADGRATRVVAHDGAATQYRSAPSRMALTSTSTRPLLISDQHRDDLRKLMIELLDRRPVPQALLRDDKE